MCALRQAARCVLWALFVLVTTALSPGDPSQAGTLIVTYDTGPNAERLPRVRMQLTDSHGREQLFPKENGFVYDPIGPSRIVAIHGLEPGTYTLEFLIPNNDGLFKPIPARQVQIAHGELVKVTQSIKPRYGALEALAEVPLSSDVNQLPTLTLRDCKGVLCAQTTLGRLEVPDLIPGIYTLEFSSLPGMKAPEPLPITVAPGEKVGPLIEHYVIETTPPTLEPNDPLAYSTVQQKGDLIIINQISAQLTIRSNLQSAGWKLIRNGLQIFDGYGSQENIPVLDGDNFVVIPEPIEGYSVRVSPGGPFYVGYGSVEYVDIEYDRLTGNIQLQALLPIGETVTLKLQSEDGQLSKQFVIRSQNGRVNWQSPSLPTGNYIVNYKLPPTYSQVPGENIRIEKGRPLVLEPQFVNNGGLHIVSNIMDAEYLLRRTSDSKVWQGHGHDFTFKAIPQGMYVLQFLSTDPQRYVPPPEMRMQLQENEQREIKASYQLAGQLLITTNIEQGTVVVQDISGKRRTIKEAIVGGRRELFLGQGRYKVSLEVPKEMDRSGLPEPVIVDISPFASAQVQLVYEKDQPPVRSEDEGELTIITNLSNGTYTVKQGERTIGKFAGKRTILSLPSEVPLEVNFDAIPNVTKPETVSLTLKKGEQRTVDVSYTEATSLAPVEAGKVIVGDPLAIPDDNEQPARIVNLKAYQIGTYPVTNAQYATWLTEAFAAGNITYDQGEVHDHADHLLARTLQADSYSHISATNPDAGAVVFAAIPGKDTYPVIHVSWYGAEAYAKDKGFRLPTEAEWEKAGGMALTKPGEPLKKYKYGFSQDIIDRAWANYKDNDLAITHFQVQTTPVGFYNGVNKLPLKAGEANQPVTHNATSPVGVYDMSGNVWEWVQDWNDPDYYASDTADDPTGPATGTEKIAKGGCYDSLADGVRVAERMALPPDHSDTFTGFRIAK